MLIIRRHPGESVVIAGNIEVTVMEITASRVRLGIQAPAEVNILRKEIQLAGEQNLAAAGAVSLAGYCSTPCGAARGEMWFSGRLALRADASLATGID